MDKNSLDIEQVKNLGM